MASKVTRRNALKLAGAGAASGILANSGINGVTAKPLPARQDVHEIVHWSWLTASDGEVWQQMIDAFNEAHADQGVQIRMEVVPDDQYGTKVLSSAAAGQAPDFGWGTAGLRADWIDKDVVLPLDELMSAAALDLADFTEHALQSSRYPTYGDMLYMIPMDAMSLQVLLNLDHAAEAGLDPSSPPQTGAELLDWAEQMTVRDGDTVTRSGFHDDRRRRAADGDVGHRGPPDGLPPGRRRPHRSCPQSGGRSGGGAMGARPLRQAPGRHA